MTCKIIKKNLPGALSLAAVFISATTPGQALAARVDSAQPSLPADSTRIKELTYGESNVYVIRTKYGYQTNIVFDQKEEIETISVGDRSLWQIIPAGNRLFIRPMTDNIATNMTLLTNKRSYEFDLKSVGEKNETNIYVARFTYPDKQNTMPMTSAMMDSISPIAYPVRDDEAISPMPKQPASGNQQHVLRPPPSPVTKANAVVEKTEQPVSAAGNKKSVDLLPAHANYSYTYAGPDELAPLQVYDDGKNTFIKYNAIGQTAPSAFIIGENGKESPVSSSVQGSSLIIDGVAGELALREDGGEIRVYNESLNPR